MEEKEVLINITRKDLDMIIFALEINMHLASLGFRCNKDLFSLSEQNRALDNFENLEKLIKYLKDRKEVD